MTIQTDLTELTTFADWCQNQDRLSDAAKNMIEVLLREAGTTDYEEATL